MKKLSDLHRTSIQNTGLNPMRKLGQANQMPDPSMHAQAPMPMAGHPNLPPDPLMHMALAAAGALPPGNVMKGMPPIAALLPKKKEAGVPTSPWASMGKKKKGGMDDGAGQY